MDNQKKLKPTLDKQEQSWYNFIVKQQLYTKSNVRLIFDKKGNAMEEKKYYSITEASAVVGVSKPTFRKMMTRPGFPLVRVSPRRIIIPADLLESWMEAETERQSHMRG